MLLLEDRRNCVYVHSKATSGEIFYVGIGKRRRANVMAQRSQHHVRTVARHGCDVHILMENLTSKEANDVEMRFIAEAAELDIDLVNMTAGGDGCKDPSPETRKAIGDGRRGIKHTEAAKALMRQRRWPNYAPKNPGPGRGGANKGRPMSEEQKQKLRVINTGKVIPPEIREKISKAGLGRVFSAERNAKVSEAKTAYWAARRAARGK